MAVIGAGVAGLEAASALRRAHDVTVYEAAARPGGHVNTVAVPWRSGTLAVDTGFMVYNGRTYPHLTALLAELGMARRPAPMSFAVSLDGGRVEYASRGLLAQPRNLLRPQFLAMLADIARFGRDARKALAGDLGATPLSEWLRRRRYGHGFIRWHLLPMVAAIWSAPLLRALTLPAAPLLRFFVEHGLLAAARRPDWYSVVGGAARYVEALAAPLGARLQLATPVCGVRRVEGGVELRDGRGTVRRFAQVVLACHPDQALRLIERPTAAEHALLGAYRYLDNEAVLHGDAALMPRRRAAWASWVYRGDGGGPTVTYWLNALQGIDPACPLFVTLNPDVEPRREAVYGAYRFRHPQLDAATFAASAQLDAIQGKERLWFCGAWCGYGFHEDGLRAGDAAAQALAAALAR